MGYIRVNRIYGNEEFSIYDEKNKFVLADIHKYTNRNKAWAARYWSELRSDGLNTGIFYETREELLQVIQFVWMGNLRSKQ